MKTAFVTGGAGFIGSHLSELLLDKGWRVKILIREGDMHKAYNDIVYQEVIEMLKNKGAEIFYGNLYNIESYKNILEGVDTIFHVAGIAYPYYGLPNKIYFDINTKATKELVKISENKGVKKFVYISSIEAAGPSLNGQPLTEESSRHPTDAYGMSKKVSEDYLLNFNKNSKMGITIIRPPMTYGERSPLLERPFKIIRSGYFPMFGLKDVYFEFCYVKNLVKGIYLAGINKNSSGEIYFISENSYKVIETMKLIGKNMGKKIKIICIPKRIAYGVGLFMEFLNVIFPFYPFRSKEIGSPLFSRKTVNWVTNDEYICSTKKANIQLGYIPDYAREDGIKNTLKWYKEKNLI